MLVANASNHDVDLDSGRVLAPWERADITLTERHTLMLDDGLLVPADPEPAVPDADQPGITTHAAQTVPAAPAAEPTTTAPEVPSPPPPALTRPSPPAAPAVPATTVSAAATLAASSAPKES